MTYTIQIDRCPFCACEAVIVQTVKANGGPRLVDVFNGQCEGCLALGPGAETPEVAAELWSRRHG